jgi:MOSC domain-containing protein YiiM
MHDVRHLTLEELEAGLGEIRRSPQAQGVLEMIVRRPKVNQREVLDTGELRSSDGLLGDCWAADSKNRGLDTQLTLMNSRAIALIAQSKDRWPLAGDQLFVDLDLSHANLPPGTRLEMGSAVIEVTAEPHTGCRKFSARFGQDAVRFVNSAIGKELHLRGICAKVVQEGTIRQGDRVRKVE